MNSPRTINAQKHYNAFHSIDWFTIFLYIVLVGLGWLSICGATYDFESAGNFIDFSTRSGMQLVWIASSVVLALIILLIDERFIESISIPLYIAFMALLLVTPLLSRDIHGSMSWIKIGNFSIQPAEFAKFATSLCLAKIMSTYEFSLSHWKDFFLCILLILLPTILIILQKETGSALVYLSMFLMLYREGMPGSILFTGMSAIIYFVIGVRYAEDPIWDIPDTSLGEFLVLMLVQAFSVGMLYVYTRQPKVTRNVTLYSLLINLLAILVSKFIIPYDITWVQLALTIATIIYLIYIAVKEQFKNYFYIALFALGSLTMHYSSNYVLENILQPHQQSRIQVLLGLKDDPKKDGYNIMQAKIAIGSGGLNGKGFLNGTQTKLKYVPEQETDFIFCTVGEEQGFRGCVLVLALFLTLILRLIHLAERQVYSFGRIYGYCLLGILLFHLFINVGMVLGLAPVIGIPLPFFSYGGSSLWGFTILLFVFLRIDAGRNRLKRYVSPR